MSPENNNRMIRCPHCGRLISQNLPVCPYCNSEMAFNNAGNPMSSNLIKYCPQCGSQMPYGSRQCMNCGQMQPDNDATRIQEPQMYGPPPNYRPEPTMYGPPPIGRSNSKMKYLLILLAALLLIGGGVAAYFLFFDKDSSSKSRNNHEVVDDDEDDEFEDDDEDMDEDNPKQKKHQDEKDTKTYDVSDEEVQTPAPPAPTPAPAPAPPAQTTAYYNYTGNITYKSNVYNFQMNLTVKGNRVSGDYIVTNGENIRVTLSGTVDSNGKAVIREYKGGSPTSYYFEGYLNSNSFSGKYKTTSRPLVMNFYASGY